jgi:3-hydroxyacyl-CoA dehydrogenase/enoyl-CoA hydratase/3-hydroxybutyryl-CoA epimerase
MTLQHWASETDANGIAWLCIDKADGGANVLSGEVLTELHSIIEPMAATPPAGVVIYSGKRNGFVMGADINEFTTIENPQQAYELGSRQTRGPALSDRGGDQWICSRRRSRTGDGL